MRNFVPWSNGQTLHSMCLPSLYITLSQMMRSPRALHICILKKQSKTGSGQGMETRLQEQYLVICQIASHCKFNKPVVSYSVALVPGFLLKQFMTGDNIRLLFLESCFTSSIAIKYKIGQISIHVVWNRVVQ